VLKLLGVYAQGVVAGGAYESIASATGTGSSGTITFSSIPSTYQHLQLRTFAISTNTSPQSGQNITLTLNGDTGNNYARHAMEGDGSAIYFNSAASTSSGLLFRSLMVTSGGVIGGAGIVDIHDYSNTSKNTTLRGFAGGNRNVTTDLNTFVGLYSGVYLNTSAINSITLTSGSGNFTTSSIFALYGIKGA
jgi:hypothetical protein